MADDFEKTVRPYITNVRNAAAVGGERFDEALGQFSADIKSCKVSEKYLYNLKRAEKALEMDEMKDIKELKAEEPKNEQQKKKGGPVH